MKTVLDDTTGYKFTFTTLAEYRDSASPIAQLQNKSIFTARKYNVERPDISEFVAQAFALNEFGLWPSEYNLSLYTPIN